MFSTSMQGHTFACEHQKDGTLTNVPDHGLAEQHPLPQQGLCTPKPTHAKAIWPTSVCLDISWPLPEVADFKLPATLVCPALLISTKLLQLASAHSTAQPWGFKA